MRNKATEEANRGKPDWEHLNEPLHVLLTVEDTQTRSQMRLQRAQVEIEKLLVPGVEGEDNLKRKQLIELALLNGTYRDNVQPKLTAPAMKKVVNKTKGKKPRVQPFHPQHQSPQVVFVNKYLFAMFAQISMQMGGLNSTWYCWADDQQHV